MLQSRLSSGPKEGSRKLISSLFSVRGCRNVVVDRPAIANFKNQISFLAHMWRKGSAKYFAYTVVT